MQKGFIQLTLMGYIAIGAAVIIGLMGIALKVQSARLESCKAEHKAFVSEVERLGKEAKDKADETNEKNRKLKEQADAELKKLRADNDKFKRLRDNSPSRGLPEAPRETRRPDLACFDRPSLESAYGELVKGLRELSDEGTENTLRLKSAVEWASNPVVP